MNEKNKMIKPFLIEIDNETNVGHVYFYQLVYNFEVNLTEELSWSFREEMQILKNCDVVYLHVDSRGGSVIEGLAIYNIIKDLKMKTIARVEGFAGSIMSVIIMACDEIWLSSVAMLMIHGPSTTAEGTEEMLLETAKGLKNLKEASVNAYKTRFRGTDEELRKMLQKDTWLYPQECLELGFCDKILEKEYTQCLEFDQIKSLVDENRDLQSQITSLTQQLLDTPKTTKQQINEYFGG